MSTTAPSPAACPFASDAPYVRRLHGIHRLSHPDVIADPAGYREAVAPLGPLFWDEVGKVWACTGYEECAAVLKDHVRFRAARLPDAGELARRGFGDAAALAEVLGLQMLFTDPPEHTAARTTLAPAFQRAAVQARVARQRRLVSRLVAELPESGQIDIVAGLAGPLPTLLVADLLDLTDRAQDVMAWADAYETLLGSLTTLPHVSDKAVVPRLLDATRALRAVVSDRRGGTGDDLVTRLANGLAPVELAGPPLERALDRAAANCLVLIGGGYQTLTQLVAMSIVLLARHPRQLALLRAQPQLLESAVNEVMRLEGSSQYVARQAVAPVEIAGQRIEEGQSIVLLLGAANRDPRRFRQPDAFDVSRSEGRHLGFGAGRHHCIGNLDAEQAAQLALSAFLERYERFALAEGPHAIVWGAHPNTRAPKEVRVELGAQTPPPPGGRIAERVAQDREERPAAVPEVRPGVDLEALRRHNDRPVSLEGEPLWTDAVAEHARRSPERTAVRAGTQEIAYGALSRTADVLATRLQDAGVEPGVVVAIVMDRRPEALVAALAVGRAGGAFLTADVATPPERLGAMLADARVGIVCTAPELADGLRDVASGTLVIGVSVAELATAPAPEPVVSGVRAGDVAYVVFTSGSTGRPKAIAVDHEGLINLSVAQRQCFRLTAGDRVLQWFSPNFDGWPFDAVLGLTGGACLVLAPSADVCVGPTLRRILREEAITVATLTPSAWRTVSTDDLPALRLASAAGEVLTSDLVDRLAAPGRRVLNLYGPAEAAVWTTWSECEPGRGDPPIGRPIINKNVYVLDSAGRPAADGEPGELWIGGVGIGRYLRQPALMRQRFRADPLALRAGGLMYNTGDICRWRVDGGLEYVGRADRQVKVRGQRIELEGVERVLAAAPQVAHATVDVRDERLVATVVVDGQFDEQATRAFMTERCNSAMVPARFEVVQAPTFTATGKLAPAEADATEPIVSETKLTWRLAQLFASALEVPQRSIKAETDFFAMGGDSLAFAELLASIEEETGLLVDVEDLIDAPSPEAIARLAVTEAGRA